MLPDVQVLNGGVVSSSATDHKKPWAQPSGWGAISEPQTGIWDLQNHQNHWWYIHRYQWVLMGRAPNDGALRVVFPLGFWPHLGTTATLMWGFFHILGMIYFTFPYSPAVDGRTVVSLCNAFVKKWDDHPQVVTVVSWKHQLNQQKHFPSWRHPLLVSPWQICLFREAYTCGINACGRAGRWLHAMQLLDGAHERGQMKFSGTV